MRGFKAVQGSIAKKDGVSQRSAGAILASASRNASPAAKAKNPNLKKVKGKKKARFKSMAKKMSSIPMGGGMATNGGY